MKNNYKFLVFFFICLFYTNISIAGGGAAGKQTSSQIKVTATVKKYCSAKSTPLSFGRYRHRDLRASTTISVTCTAGTPYYIGVSSGKRSMTNGKDALRYSVHSDSNGSRLLGNRFDENTISGVGTGRTETVRVHAFVEDGQRVSSGFYQDMLYITLSF
jgi:spore coat protein U-like protein